MNAAASALQQLFGGANAGNLDSDSSDDERLLAQPAKKAKKTATKVAQVPAVYSMEKARRSMRSGGQKVSVDREAAVPEEEIPTAPEPQGESSSSTSASAVAAGSAEKARKPRGRKATTKRQASVPEEETSTVAEPQGEASASAAGLLAEAESTKSYYGKNNRRERQWVLETYPDIVEETPFAVKCLICNRVVSAHKSHFLNHLSSSKHQKNMVKVLAGEPVVAPPPPPPSQCIPAKRNGKEKQWVLENYGDIVEEVEDEGRVRCVVCNKTVSCHKSHFLSHLSSSKHLKNVM